MTAMKVASAAIVAARAATLIKQWTSKLNLINCMTELTHLTPFVTKYTWMLSHEVWPRPDASSMLIPMCSACCRQCWSFSWTWEQMRNSMYECTWACLGIHAKSSMWMCRKNAGLRARVYAFVCACTCMRASMCENNFIAPLVPYPPFPTYHFS